MTDPPAEIRFYRAAGKYAFLSNLYPCTVRIKVEEADFGYLYASSAEHAYQWAKARSPEMRGDILCLKLPRAAAILGHGLYPFDVVDGWTEKKLPWMQRVVRAKFSHPFLAACLVDTGDAPLIEDSKTDSYWGIGKKGDGQNWLGKILMDVRSALDGSVL